jgi:hypothetical protein
MNSLTEAALKVLTQKNRQEQIEDEHQFIELLTFSSSEQIVEMLNSVMAEDWIGLPVWARNLSFRMACLLEPTNAQLRRRAAADLRCFGPDWDLEAERLEREAGDLEKISDKFKQG